MMDTKVYWRDNLWPILRYYPNIPLEEQRKIMEKSGKPVYGVNWNPPVLTIMVSREE
jgi:hypothetical protein